MVHLRWKKKYVALIIAKIGLPPQKHSKHYEIKPHGEDSTWHHHNLPYDRENQGGNITLWNQHKLRSIQVSHKKTMNHLDSSFGPSNKSSCTGHKMAPTQSSNAIWRPMVILGPPLTLQSIATRFASLWDVSTKKGGMFKKDRVA